MYDTRDRIDVDRIIFKPVANNVAYSMSRIHSMMLKKTAAFAFAVLLASAIGIPALASSLTDAEIQTLLQERIDQNRMGVGIVVGVVDEHAQHITLGHGVGVIDPHGDLAEELLHHVPPWRADHLVYFNPGDLEFPIGLNVLANVTLDGRHLVASGIVGAFKGIWRDSWGPRLEYILYNAVSALLDCRNATLLGVNRLLTDPNFRAKVIRQIKDPFIRAFWAEEYEGYDERFQREAIAPIQNKLGQFLLNPVIRNILGQVKTKVEVPFIMDNERLFIANLSKGRLGHDKANLLGSLLTTQFQLGAT